MTITEQLKFCLKNVILEPKKLNKSKNQLKNLIRSKVQIKLPFLPINKPASLFDIKNRISKSSFDNFFFVRLESLNSFFRFF